MTRLVGINHVALEVDDIDQSLALYGQFSSSSCAGAHGAGWPSSTWATSSSRSSPGARSRRTWRATSGSSSTTRRRFGAISAAGVRCAGRRAHWTSTTRGQPHPGRRLPRHPVLEDAEVLGGMGLDGLEKRERRSRSCVRRGWSASASDERASRVRCGAMKELRGSARISVPAPSERCISLFEAVGDYPSWYPEVVQEVTVLEREADGRPSRVQTTLHVAKGPITKDFHLVLAVVSDRRSEVALSRVKQPGSGNEEFEATWQVTDSAARRSASTSWPASTSRGSAGRRDRRRDGRRFRRGCRQPAALSATG